METSAQKKRFSLRKRIKSANHAWRGIGVMFRHGHNASLAVVLAALVSYLGFALSISSAEWMALLFCFALVFSLEAVNTALEIDMDLTSPGYHPHARDTKDVAAGAVLLAVFFSAAIGLIIFVPKILPLIALFR